MSVMAFHKKAGWEVQTKQPRAVRLWLSTAWISRTTECVIDHLPDTGTDCPQTVPLSLFVVITWFRLSHHFTAEGSVWRPM